MSDAGSSSLMQRWTTSLVQPSATGLTRRSSNDWVSGETVWWPWARRDRSSRSLKHATVPCHGIAILVCRISGQLADSRQPNFARFASNLCRAPSLSFANSSSCEQNVNASERHSPRSCSSVLATWLSSSISGEMVGSENRDKIALTHSFK